MADFPPASVPPFIKWERLADRYPMVEGPKFADGGMDTFLSSTTPIRRWRITYEGLTVAQAAILDAWFAANFGFHSAFTFTERDAATYGGCKCVEYERGHGRRYDNMQFRTIVIEDRP